MLRRFPERFEALGRILDYCDEATFFDNENGFIEVARYENGEFLTVGDYRPEWLMELQAVLQEGK